MRFFVRMFTLYERLRTKLESSPAKGRTRGLGLNTTMRNHLRRPRTFSAEDGVLIPSALSTVSDKECFYCASGVHARFSLKQG